MSACSPSATVLLLDITGFVAVVALVGWCVWVSQ